jgi:hypothetical protein
LLFYALTDGPMPRERYVMKMTIYASGIIVATPTG